MMRQIFIAITIMGLVGQGSCQLPGLLGTVANTVGNTVGGVAGGTVGGIVGTFVPGLFINDWWAGNVLNVAGVRNCNEYIAKYGCTGEVHSALVSAQASAAAAGWGGFAEAVSVASVTTTGGIGPCYRGDYTVAQAQAQAFVSTASGGRKMLSAEA